MKRVIKIIIVEIILITIIFSYLLLRDSNITPTENSSNKKLSEEFEEIIIDKVEIYSKIEMALLNGDQEIEFSVLLKAEEIFSILNEIVSKNPEVMYYKGAEYRFGKLTLNYSKSSDEIIQHQKEIREIRSDFITKYISDEMTNYEKLLTAHDYIINNSRYDTRLMKGETPPPESYTAYGILKLGIGVCEGYAKAMKYLLDEIGIESMIVIGESKGESHAWNLVKLEDEYYHIDVTWDDPVTPNGKDILRYNFFNVDDEEISKTHNWNRENYPAAKGKKYNYFIYNDLLVHSKSEFEEKIKQAMIKKKSSILLKINNLDENIYLNDIVEAIAYENYNIVKLRSYSYSIDKEYGIINIEFHYYKE